MASLEDVRSRTRSPLASRHLIGRARTCHLQIAQPSVSGLHAELLWDGGSWQVQDLGSRNGTFVDGRKLAAGEQCVLSVNAELRFGIDAQFRLIDDSPPQLMAISDSGTVRVADGEILCLPAPEQCEASIFLGADQRWELETDSGVRTLDDQETVVVGGQAWRICLPSRQAMTQDAKLGVGPTLDDVTLEFFVSRDEEHVDLTLRLPDHSLELESRAHTFLLLLLARCRQHDARELGLPDSEQGWTYREDLVKMLAIDEPLLNLWVYRARQQLQQAGIHGAAGIIKRRPNTQQLRLGVGKVEVETA